MVSFTRVTPRPSNKDDLNILQVPIEQLTGYTAKTTTYTAKASVGLGSSDAGDGTISCDTSGGAWTLSLVSAVTFGAGNKLTISKIDVSVNALTIDPAGSETIDGDLTIKLYGKVSLTLKSNGANWLVDSGKDVVFRGTVNVRWFGLEGDGVNNHNTAINNAAAVAFTASYSAASGMSSSSGAASKLYLPPGDYVYDGSGLDYARMHIVGDGPQHTRITLGASAYLVNSAGSLSSIHLEGFQVVGGKGLFRHSRTAANVLGPALFRNLWGIGYTECFIGTMSSDYPYWTVEDIMFRGTAASSIGLAHAGDASGSVMTKCRFELNRYGVKLGIGGVGWRIDNNDFLRLAAGAQPLTDIWVIPAASFSLSGQNFRLTGNKFGNENLTADDYHIIYADEDTGTDFLTKYHKATASTGSIRGHIVAHNTFDWTGGTDAVPMIYATTDEIHEGMYGPNMCSGQSAAKMLGLLDGTTTNADRTVATNIWGPFLNYGVPNEAPSLAYPIAKPWYGQFDDRFGAYQEWDASPRGFPGAGADPETVHIFSALPSTWTLNGTSARTNTITDITGGTVASELEFVASTDTVSVTIGAQTSGRPTYFEIDLKVGAASPVAVVELRFTAGGGSPIEFRKYVTVPAGWRRFRWQWWPRNGAAGTFTIRPNTSTTGKVQVANLRVYHAREPGGDLFGAKTQDWASIADGAQATTTVTVTGAKLGDFARASMDVTLQGMLMNAYVSAADTVTVVMQNESGGAIDLASATLRARVERGT